MCDGAITTRQGIATRRGNQSITVAAFLPWGFVDLPNDDAFAPYPRPTCSLNANHPDIVAYAPRETAGLMTARDKAVALYYAVCDEVR